MANFQNSEPPNGSLGGWDVPLASEIPLATVTMPPKRRPISPDLWVRAEALFDQVMEASDPDALLKAEPDAELAALVRSLWEEGQRGGGVEFLDQPPTLISELAGRPNPRFQDGQQLARRFTIERPLGAGGMGEVYLAHDQVLREKVALKTIRRDLAADPAIARRFLAEVRNARRVTHPYVCRINDIFDDGGVPFFTMEYIQGVRLSDWLKISPTSRTSEKTRRRIALQLAEGLRAAHHAGIVHCDFKPSNVLLTGQTAPTAVITDFGLARASLEGAAEGGLEGLYSHSLRAGTGRYMAPELVAGGPAGVRTDIYSFGKVLGELLPGHRLAGQCAAESADDRPRTLDGVVAALGGRLTRRLWLTGGVVAAASAAVGFYGLISSPRFVLASRQRVAVNGFRPDGTQTAFAVRDLLVTALRQSPLLSVMADDHLRSLLRTLQYRPQLPADTSGLLALAAREGALAIDGALRPVGRGLQLALQVFSQGESRPVLSLTGQVDDARQVVKLADDAAQRLRRELGESAGSLARNVPLAKVTSAVPEAVELYYQGIRESQRQQDKRAMVFYDRALQEDPQFALAHLQRAASLGNQNEMYSALASCRRAYDLRANVSEREQLWIAEVYYNTIRDYQSCFEACKRVALLYPEEATFQRHAGFAASRLGRPAEALPYNRRAVDLDPDNESNLSEWLANQCDANLYDAALTEFQRFRELGHTSTLLDYGAGVAYTGKGAFANALAAFDRMGSDAQAEVRHRWARMLRAVPRIASGRWAEAASELTSDIAYDEAVNEEVRQMTRRYWLGMLHVLMDSPWRAVTQVEVLVHLDASPAWLQALREGSMLALEVGQPELARQALERLREIAARWPSTHSRGSLRLLEGLLEADNDPQSAFAKLAEARGLWPDPITLFSVGRFLAGRREFAEAVSTLEMLEEARGRTYRLFFPGLVSLGRLERARSLVSMSRFDEASRLYRRVMEDWGDGVAGFRIGRQVRGEYANSIRDQAQRR